MITLRVFTFTHEKKKSKSRREKTKKSGNSRRETPILHVKKIQRKVKKQFSHPFFFYMPIKKTLRQIKDQKISKRGDLV